MRAIARIEAQLRARPREVVARAGDGPITVSAVLPTYSNRVTPVDAPGISGAAREPLQGSVCVTSQWTAPSASQSAMFQAFFDESEVDPVYLIAGWIAAAEEWTKFSVAWNAVLAGAPPVRYFRHHDAKMLKGEFEGWSSEDAQAKLDALVKVICDHELYGVTTGLNTKTWKQAFQSELSPKRLKGLLKFTHYYQSCFHSAVAIVMQQQLTLGHASDVVDCVFDQQDGLLKDSIKHYAYFKNSFSSAMQKIAGEISVGNDKDTPALQAADLLAGQLTTTLKCGPSPTYQTLVKCHQVIQAKAYPPKFQTFPAMVKAISWAWSKKRELDAQISAEDKRSRDKKTNDE